jgi:hypothetical protein
MSCWINAQSFAPSGQQSCIFSFGNSANSSVFVLILQANATLTAAFQISGGSYVNIGSTTISTNTWYYVNVIYQSSGLCYCYVNNNLVGTVSGQALYGAPTQFYLARLSETTQQAFNGYVDDLRIWNSVIPYTPVSIINPVGTLSYVPGAVGQTAVNLVNTAGGTAMNYIRGSWQTPTSYTASGWFNLQSYSTVSNQFIFSTGGNVSGNVVLFIDLTTKAVMLQLPNLVPITTNQIILLNTWYHFHIIIQPSGNLCYLYINGTPYTATATGNAVNSGSFGIGVLDSSIITNAFNGYIDDFRLYNAAIPFYNHVPRNYTHLTMSGNSAYRMAASQLGNLFLSSDSGLTWTRQTTAATPGAWSSLSASYSGQYLTAQSQPVVQPNQLNLAAATWSQQGVTYTASASSTYLGHVAYGAFNNSLVTDGWASNNDKYSNGTYLNANSTTVSTLGILYGEWLQLQTSIPLIIDSYRFAQGTPIYAPKTYYIVGSNDGSTWFPIHYAVFTTNPTTTSLSVWKSMVQINYSGIQTVISDSSVSINTTSYPTSKTAYLYFRIIATSVFNGSLAEIRELYANFLGGSITPNQSGITSSTWSQSGTTWSVSASSIYNASFLEYNLLDNTPSTRWATANVAANGYTSGPYSGSTSTTIQGGIGSVLGEWYQLRTFIPMVLQEYTFGGGYTPNQFIKEYYIVGSNDASTWYPLQRVIFTINPITQVNAFTKCVNNILMTYSGTQVIQGDTAGQATTTPYSQYVTQAFQYFRIVITAVWSGGAVVEIGEWYPVFTAGQNSSTNYGVTWTPTLQTGDAFNVTKNITVTSGGSGWVALPSFRPLSTGLTFSIWFTFSSTPAIYSKLFEAATSANPTNAINIQYNVSGGLSAVFYVNSNFLPLISTNTTFANNTLYHLVWTIDSSGNHSIYVNGSLDKTGSGSINVINYPFFAIGKGNFTGDPYANMTIRDFRMFNRAVSFTEVTSLYQNLNYGSASTPFMSLSESGQYSLVGDGLVTRIDNNYLSTYSNNTYTVKSPSGINAPIVATAVSQTGQYMVLVTSGITNNVYYSTDYGATFTGLTIGSSAMVSCAISYDGSYLTVTNTAGAVYTLNKNSSGYTLAIGNQAGAINQASNAIAIGNQAGAVNQSANSIVLNASGSSLNTGSSGFYVAPIGTTSGLPTDLLGYGADSQIVKTGINVLPGGGIVGPITIGTANTTPTYLSVNGRIRAVGEIIMGDGYAPTNGIIRMTTAYGENFIQSGLTESSNSKASLIFGSIYAGEEWMRIVSNGNIGIGTYNPSSKLDVWGSIYSRGAYQQLGAFMKSYVYVGQVGGAVIGSINTSGTELPTMYITDSSYVGIGTTNPGTKFHVEGHIGTFDSNVMGIFSAAYGDYLHIGSWNRQGSISKNIVLNQYGGFVGIGITNPSSLLHIAKAVTANSDYGLMITYENTQPGYWEWQIGPQVINGSAIFSVRGGGDGLNSLLNVFNIHGNTNVGIGTTNPTQKLDVAGSINCSGLLVNGVAVATGTGSVWGVSGSNISYTSGTVGIGTNDTGSRLVVMNDSGGAVSNMGIMKVMRGPNAAGEDKFWLGFSHGTSGADSNDRARIGTYIQTGGKGHLFFTTGIGGSQAERLRIDGDGNIGIGITNPVSKLECFVTQGEFIATTLTRSGASQSYGVGINFSLLDGTTGYRGNYARVFGGSFNATASTSQSQATGYFAVDVANTGAFASDITVHSSQLFITATKSWFNTSVGIGITNPVSKLSIQLDGTGAYSLSDWTSGYALFGIDTSSSNGSAVGITYNTAGNYGSLLCIAPNVAWRNMLYSAGLHTFFINGIQAGYVNSSGFNNGSDEREKLNISDINTEHSLQRILALTPKKYQRKMNRNDPLIPQEDKDKYYIGLIAQEVQQINPYCISTWKNEEGEERLGIHYQDFVLHLIGSVKEQQNQINELTQKLSTAQEALTQFNAVLSWAKSQGFSG